MASSKPTTSTTVDTVFARTIDALSITFASAAARQLYGTISWVKLDARDATGMKIVDGFNSSDISSIFSRSGTSKTYVDSTTPDKQSPYFVAQAAKIQGDFLSAIERDTRMRYRSRVRMQAHGLAREMTHGLNDGPLSAATQLIKLILKTDN